MVRGKVAARRERGIALIFALGLLSLLLVLGLAFVSNALVARKVARNNSYRTQAKLLLQSAISRAAASVMFYQEQLMQTAPAELLTEDFSQICSYGGDAIPAGSASTLYNDGLLGEYSLMLLPDDDTSVSRAAAVSFNARFKSDAMFPWQGRWNYFFNSANGADRRIIGRAAWQVISSPAQILAPVFFRGNFGEVPGDAAHPSQMRRWGRDIHEVDLSGTRLFANVGSKYKGGHISDFENCITKGIIQAENDGDRRWLERWFILDPKLNSGTHAAWEPNASQSVPETYVYQPENSTKKRQLCRFNISDLYTPALTEAEIKQKYGVSTDADPWYARFRIDSTTSADVNSENALTELTRDSAPFANHQYDYELTTAESRSGLPFLRRIGADKATFDSISSLRKQIAANFNDYCDGDSVPTSDIPAKNWGKTDNDPSYTGNEKTPYLYEFGALAAFVRNPAAGTLTGDQPGIGCTLSPVTGTAARSFDFNFGLRISPVVKLANLYFVKESGACRNLQAEMTLGDVAGSFKIRKVILKGLRIHYRSGGRNYNVNVKDFSVEVGSGTWKQYPSLRALGLDTGVFSFAVKGEDIVSGEGLSIPAQNWDNSGGSNPYPLMYFSSDAGDSNAKVWHTVTADKLKNVLKFNGGSASLPTLKLTAAEAQLMAAASLPASYSNFTILTQPTAWSIDQILLTGFSMRPRRVLLTAERKLKDETTERFGIDYVREFQKYPFAWSSAAGKVLDFSGTAKNGFLLGGIRNYDPRQNLNNADWYPYPEPGESALKAMPLLTVVQDYAAPGIDEIGAVIIRDQVNTAYAGVENAFDPSAQNEENPLPGDRELCNQPGRIVTSGLSTAVIRNAPMMSPWEIGMLHRGVRWQTVNLKNSSSPANPESPVRPCDYAANGDSWDKSGTDYVCGDAGLLDQIKMCQLGSTYGKININMLWSSHPEFDGTRDADIFRALFEGICYGEESQNFPDRSTRDAGGYFKEESSGTDSIYVPDGAFPEPFRKMADSSIAFPKTEKNQPDARRYASRAQFVDFLNGTASLSNAFGMITNVKKDDAHLEEIIGKTVNLLTTETTVPERICLVVIAQIILDCAGMRYLISQEKSSKFTTTSGETLKSLSGNLLGLSCEYGRFDAAIHQDDSDKNLYFDGIAGEVKAFVSLLRDPETGRLSIEKINYVE